MRGPRPLLELTEPSLIQLWVKRDLPIRMMPMRAEEFSLKEELDIFMGLNWDKFLIIQ
jgi:hypothetical protein